MFYYISQMRAVWNELLGSFQSRNAVVIVHGAANEAFWLGGRSAQLSSGSALPTRSARLHHLLARPLALLVVVVAARPFSETKKFGCVAGGVGLCR
jgi:hypothetical protein